MTVGLFLSSTLDMSNTHEVPFHELAILRDALQKRDTTPRIIDFSEYPNGPLTTATPNGKLAIGDTTIHPDTLTSAVVFPQFLFQHLYYKQWDDLHEKPVETLNQLREHRGLFEGLLTILADQNVRLTCPPDAFATHHRKLWQMYAFDRHNIPTPETVITTDPAEAKAFAENHGRMVAKPISGGFVPEVMTSADITDEELEIIQRTPVQLQTYAPGTDTRLYVVDSTTVGAIQYTLDSDQFSFKVASHDSVTVTPFDPPEKMTNAAEDAADICNVSFATIDIRYDPDTETFTVIEVNPGGRFAAAEEAGVNVADPLADWLANPT